MSVPQHPRKKRNIVAAVLCGALLLGGVLGLWLYSTFRPLSPEERFARAWDIPVDDARRQLELIRNASNRKPFTEENWRFARMVLEKGEPRIAVVDVLGTLGINGDERPQEAIELAAPYLESPEAIERSLALLIHLRMGAPNARELVEKWKDDPSEAVQNIVRSADKIGTAAQRQTERGRGQ
ncbi:MAG: hypothetical protein ACK4P3_04395 [Fimbriimonadaceae bacterium]